MPDAPFDTVLSALNKVDFDPAQPQIIRNFVAALFGMYGIAPLAPPEGLPKKRKSRRGSNGPINKLNVRFGNALSSLLKDGPRQPRDLIEPCRAMGLRRFSDTDDILAEKQIITGFKKCRGKYCEYPGGKWGLKLTLVPLVPRSQNEENTSGGE